MRKGMPNDRELCDASTALADWFISQEINVAQSAIIMIHFLGVIIGDYATDVSDLQEGIKRTNEGIEYRSAHAFAVKHHLI